MSEYNTQERNNTVSLEQFIAAMKFCVPANELKGSIAIPNQESLWEEGQTRRRLILRLLDPSGTEAFDRFVEVAAADDIASQNSRESLLVSVRTVWPDVETGEIEAPYPVDPKGIIPDKRTPDFDRGYFVDMPGMDADEFYTVRAMAEGEQAKKAPPLEYFSAQLPSE